MGISMLVSGLQLLSMSARLPVRHCGLMYSLSSGSAWASMDIITDTSTYNRHGPVVSMHSAKLAAAAAAAAEVEVESPPDASTESALALNCEDVSRAREGGAGRACGHRRRLQSPSAETLQAARQAAGVFESAWTLGLLRLAVFAGAVAAVVTLHSVALAVWEHAGPLRERPVPRLLAFPRLEVLLLLAMPTGLLPPPQRLPLRSLGPMPPSYS